MEQGPEREPRRIREGYLVKKVCEDCMELHSYGVTVVSLYL